MPRPTLLTFNLPADRQSKLRMVCMRLGILLRPVSPEELSHPLAALCGLTSPSEPQPAPDFSDEMLLFAHMDNGTVQRFLQTSRQMKAPSIALKAVLTPTNAAWTPGQLAAELRAEREAIQNGQNPAHGE